MPGQTRNPDARLDLSDVIDGYIRSGLDWLLRRLFCVNMKVFLCPILKIIRKKLRMLNGS